jgi:hypothetical protein
LLDSMRPLDLVVDPSLMIWPMTKKTDLEADGWSLHLSVTWFQRLHSMLTKTSTTSNKRESILQLSWMLGFSQHRKSLKDQWAISNQIDLHLQDQVKINRGAAGMEEKTLGKVWQVSEEF